MPLRCDRDWLLDKGYDGFPEVENASYDLGSTCVCPVVSHLSYKYDYFEQVVPGYVCAVGCFSWSV